MKTEYKLLPVVLFFICCIGFSQTPEQQKMIDNAIRMRDSIMACMNLEEVLQQADNQEKRQASVTKAANVKTIPGIDVLKIEDKYWKNTLASDMNTRLVNWKNGEADLVFNYNYDSRKDVVEYVNIGVIKPDGTIVLKPTSEVPNLKPLNNFKNSNNFYDIHDSDIYRYGNGDSGFILNSYVLVYKNDKQIGMLTVGNSVKVTHNLGTAGDLYFGDEGYLLSWAYADEACSIKANEHWKGDLSNTGTPLVVETNVTYDLAFKPGWNLVKTEVIGEYTFPNAPEEDRSRYKKHEHTIVNTIPNDATYFFKSTIN